MSKRNIIEIALLLIVAQALFINCEKDTPASPDFDSNNDPIVNPVSLSLGHSSNISTVVVGTVQDSRGSRVVVFPAVVDVARGEAVTVVVPEHLDDMKLNRWNNAAGNEIGRENTVRIDVKPDDSYLTATAVYHQETPPPAPQLPRGAVYTSPNTYNGKSALLLPPPIDDATAKKTAFAVSYKPNCDDDFWYHIKRSFLFLFAFTGGGNGGSYIRVLATSVELLPGMESWTKELVLTGSSTTEITYFTPPAGYKAVGYTEVLGMVTNGDDDFSVFSRSFSVGRTICFVARTDLGNSGSTAYIRCNVIYWPESTGLNASVTRLSATSGQTVRAPGICLGSQPVLVTVNSQHSSMTPVKAQEAMEQLQKQVQLSRPGISFHSRGLASSGGLSISASDAIKYGKALEGIIKTLINWLTDDNDDDFYMDIQTGSCSISLSVGDGNNQSMGEITIIQFH